MGCTILILVTGSGGFLRKREKKTQTLLKFYTAHRQFVHIRGWEVGEWGDFSVISKQ